MTFHLFRKTLSGLSPRNDQAAEALAKVKLGADVVIEWRKPRNLKWMRLYWCIVELIAENLPGEHDTENVSDLIKIRMGHVTRIGTKSGVIEVPKSISFAKMNQSEWEEFYARFERCVCGEIIPGLASEDLRAAVLERMGPQ